MPIKIHHGPPGSYKTSGALQDDFLESVFSGRVLVTNVRGLDDVGKIRAVLNREFKKRIIPDSFKIINVDHNTVEGAKKWSVWFHWVPIGAFLIVDEAQDVWKDEWRDTALKDFDYPGGPDRALTDGRPKTFKDSFQRHRHFNWDMTLTTPDIASIRKDIRGISEMAYFHKNLATIGVNGRYLEASHLANRSATESNFINVQPRRIKKYVFELYESTSTGDISDSKTGIPFWRTGHFIGLMALLIFVWSFVASMGLPTFWKKKESEKEKKIEVFESNNEVRISSNDNKIYNGKNSEGDFVARGSNVPALDILNSKVIYVVGRMGVVKQQEYFFELMRSDELQGIIVSDSVLKEMGYVITAYSVCLVKLAHKSGGIWFARCRGLENENKAF